MSESEADKKRNKLGYQRISVACGHCRRRKIRCVMADADPQGRCSNCIRLGKQCVFYPVDQTGPPESKASSSSKISTTPNASSSSSAAPSHSPQELAAGRPFDTNNFPVVPSVPSNVPQAFGGVPFEAGFQGQGPEYGYRPQEYMRAWSGPGDLSPNTQSAMAGPVGGFPQGNIAPYSPFAGGDSIHSTPTDTRSFSFPAPEDERQWHMYQQQQQPTRAMSYGFETMHTSYAGPSPVYAGAHPVHDMSGVPHGLTGLDIQSAHMHQASGPQSAPASAPMTQQFSPGMPYTYQPQPQPAQPGWYAPTGNYDSYGPGTGEGDASSRRTQR
ncbi:hypothetical protein AMS68_006712 [Peltaster fructicola]|uniref:Zn(2)-C6 fungal-type domain-containing protein n=1 Tax=Peltaster fructicola TaxID=286661 RepID=A0A6H0Y2P9_9PEZI|nr:hypothetical protein AMS68_006712 [Peltaster fructicola]